MTLQQIDSICDEFEAALRRGDTLIIEDFLPKVAETQQSALLKELLEIEMQFVTERSSTDSSLRNMQESLKKRFPEQHELINSLFQQTFKLRQIGDYEILGELGRGGMGIVYKAKHKLLHQTVAIKVLSQNLLDDSQAVGRFKREMQLIGGLAHPNIVRALNAGEIEGTHYLAMEFVEGVSLHKLVESVRQAERLTEPQSLDCAVPAQSKDCGSVRLPVIPLGAACEAIRQAALGLQNVHELKLVHRDIKPANLMLDARGTVKILDLGLGKFAEEQRDDYHSSLTMEGMVVGTVDYISPEQCENSREADIRSDLYSLGCTLYYLLTGKPVYSGSRYNTMRKKLMAHIVGELPSLRTVLPDVPLEIEAILQKAVAKDPAERFQTPIEFAEALAPFASFEELWTLVGEVIPTDTPGLPRSDSRHSSTPYGTVLSSRQSIVAPPASRVKRIAFFVALNLLICGLLLAVALYYVTPSEKTRLEAMRVEAQQAEESAEQFWKEWKMAEAQAEYRKGMAIRARKLLQTQDGDARLMLLQNRYGIAMTHWYLGDLQRARQDMQSLVNSIDDSLQQGVPSETELLDVKMSALERLSDFVLFGGAASGRNRERFANALSRYEEAIRVPTRNSHDTEIRWKQAILHALNDNLEEAERLLQENPPLPDKNLYYTYTRQLADAVVFYCSRAGGVSPPVEGVSSPTGGLTPPALEHGDRDQRLRTFRRQMTSQSNVAQGITSQPEMLELLLFSGELLLYDSIKHEDWGTLSADFTSINSATGTFLRQYPGATPFMRRFNELLIHSAVQLHDNAEQARDKRRHIDSIVRLLERMRQTPSGEPSTVIYFFLPTSETDTSFVIFYPHDGREGTLYPLPLTRTMVSRGERVPPLDETLLEQIKNEAKIRISWDDSASWSRGEDAMTETNYPYKDVLPLQSR